jgi:curved DNA-binding protein CbpA
MAEVLPSDSTLTRPMLTRRAPLVPFPVELLTPTHYARLGLPENSDAAAIEEAWLRLRRAAPRTTTGVDEAGASLKAIAWPQPGLSESPAIRARQREVAYAVLSNPVRRAVYDRWLTEHRGRITTPPATSRWQTWLHTRRGHWQIGLMLGVLATGALVWLAT